jgi:elongation factor G
MPRHSTQLIRNIALTGHANCGKTTLIEALLEKAKVIGKAGSVEGKDTVCDFEQEEQEHGHSLNAAFVNFDFTDDASDPRHFNLIDTPGFPDFLGQTLSVLPAVETCAVVIDAERGIQTTTRRVMKTASERRLPRMIIINKIDTQAEQEGTLRALVEQIREVFGKECLPLNLPTPDCSDVVDLWEKAEDGEGPGTRFSSISEGHQQLVDQIVEVDEELMAVYLEEGALTKDQLHDAFEKSLREAHLVPILFVSARTGAGVQDMLHLMSNLCPSPIEGNPRPFILGEEGKEDREWHADPSDPAKTFVGHVFKVTTDQFVGKVAMIRVHQGTIKAGDSVQLGDSRKPLKLAHLNKVFGKKMEPVDGAVAGDIIAVAKIDEFHRDTVIHQSKNDALNSLRFKSIPMPRPMYGVAIEAKNRGDEVKIGSAMAKLVEEDPTFKFERINATKQTVVSGMGDLHMRVILEKLQNRYKLELDTHPPKVAYKESITGKASASYRHKKQTGGSGQFGEVHLTVEPLPADEYAQATDPELGMDFVDETVGGSIPRQFMPAIEKGIRQAMQHGAVAGYPMTGVRVRVTDGKHHPVDSKEIAFTTAGKKAFIQAVKNADPALLEPICSVEITAPATTMGDITADLSGKRAHMGDTEYLPGDMMLIHAKAPLAEMGRFTNELKSITAGQGTFVMDYSHDENTPGNVQADIIAAYAPEDDDD